MEKVNYYHFSTSMDPNIVGDINRVEQNYQIEEFIDSENNNEERFDKYHYFDSDKHINNNLDITKFKTHDKAKMTDLMSTSFFPNKGYFASRYFVELLKGFHTEGIEILNCIISNNNKQYDYYLISTVGSEKYINIEKSTFGIFENEELIEEVKFSNSEELSNKSREIFFEKNILPDIIPLKVILTGSVDLFKSNLDMSVIISERLKNEIESKSLTGFDFHKFEMKTEFYEDF